MSEPTVLRPESGPLVISTVTLTVAIFLQSDECSSAPCWALPHTLPLVTLTVSPAREAQILLFPLSRGGYEAS